MISFKSQLPINNKAMIFYLARHIDIIRAVSPVSPGVVWAHARVLE